MELSVSQWMLAGVAAFCIGLDKTGFSGLVYIAIAILAQVFDARQSVAIALPVLISGDIIATIIFRRHANWKAIRYLLGPTIAGMAVGYVFFKIIPVVIFRPLLGGIILFLCAVHFFREWYIRRQSAVETANLQWWLVGIFGIAGGMATLLANAAGPIAAFYFLARRLPKYAFIGTMAWFFFIVNFVKIPFQISLGILTYSTFKTGAALIVFCILGACTGPFLIRFVPQKMYNKLIWTMIVVGAIKLLVA